MSPFKKCLLSSQEVLYRSLYLNPLSDSPEHPHRSVIPLLRQDSSSSPATAQLPQPPSSSSSSCSSISTGLSFTPSSLIPPCSSSSNAYHHCSSFPTHMKLSSDHVTENGNYVHQQFKENDPPHPVLLKQKNAGKTREHGSTTTVNTATASAAGVGGVKGKTNNSSSFSREPLRPVAASSSSPSSKRLAPVHKSSGAVTDLQVAALLPTGRGEEIVKEGPGEDEDEEEAALVPASAAIAAAAEAEGCYFEGAAPLLLPPPTPSHLSHVWDDPASELAAPASAWSTIGNRTLLCRPLPLDVGRCVCYISREKQDGCSIYSLYTDEGYGRQDRKLAVARHRRKAGRSEFVIYPSSHNNVCSNNDFNPSKSHINGKNSNVSNGLEKGPSASSSSSSSSSEDAIIGRMQANLLGSRYCVWDEVDTSTGKNKGRRQLLGVVMFEPTITTLTGTFRVMKVSIPKYQSMQITSSTQHEKNGLAPNWEEKIANVYQLCSRKPYYNKVSRRYELDFRDRAKRSSRIKTSAKNLQLTMDENGKQAILMLGKVGKSKYVMEYRFPLTGYQAFSVCLASLDSKLCCSI